MGGFVESPATEEIAALARKKRVPFVEDLGSGAMTATEAGGRRTRTYACRGAAPRRGRCAAAPISCWAVHKPASSPARLDWSRMRSSASRFRALRYDKLILSALQTTVDLYSLVQRPRPCPRWPCCVSRRRTCANAHKKSWPRSKVCR
jgi:hypothetical protein